MIVKFPIYCAAGVVGGLIGAAIWAGITFASGYEIGWIAWGIGFLVGLAVRMGAGEEVEGTAPGVTAAVIAVLAILVRKYAAASMLVDKHMPDFGGIDPAGVISGFADEIVEECTTAGKPINWPPGKNVETAKVAGDYPADIWQEANTKWNDLGPAGQQKLRDERAAAMKKIMGALKGNIVWEAFKASFGPVDIIFFLLALATSYKLGAALPSD
jgi:hypothetical protein